MALTNTYCLKMTPSQFGQSSVVVNCSQYDSLFRVIQFNLYNGTNEFSIPDNCVVTIRGTKKDLTGFEYQCEYEGNVVTFPIQDQVTVLPGKVPAEIRVTSGNEIIGSWNFVFLVEESPLDENTIISETDLPLLESALEAAAQAESFKNIAEQSATDASASASEASESASTATTKAEESADSALKSEGYAVGEQNGEPVDETSIYYHNNAKWYSQSGGGGGTHNYEELANKPSINNVTLVGDKSLSDLGVPTKTSELTNDSNFVSDASYVHTDNNFSNTYRSKLDGIENFAEVNVQSDWNVTNTSSDAFIKNKPSIPSKTSDLTNDSNFQNATQVENLIDSHISSTYKAGGSLYFANLPTPSAQYLGMVYDIKDAFVTNELFEEGSGISYPGGTDVAIIIDNGVYKYDVLSGFVDLSNYATQTDLTNGLATKQNVLSNGSGISISNNTVTNTGVLSVNGQDGDVNITVPTKTSDLTNDSGFITSVPVTSVNGKTGAVVLAASDVGALSDATVIPTKTSELTNDSGFLTSVPVTSVNNKTGAVNLSASDVGALPTSTVYVSSVNGQSGAVTGLQTTSNLVTSVSSSSTDSQYPSAKCLYDLVGDIETLLASI